MTTFRSVLSITIGSYLTLKRALGRQYAAEEWVLAHLDRFLAARHADLVAETFAAWCLTPQHLASGTRRDRMRIVRNLCPYPRRNEPGCFLPDERLFPRVRHRQRGFRWPPLCPRPARGTSCAVGRSGWAADR